MFLLCMYSVALRGNVVVGFYNIYIFFILLGVHLHFIQRLKQNMTQSKQQYLLLSASTGSIPGKLIVMADGAPTSYVLIGL